MVVYNKQFHKRCSSCAVDQNSHFAIRIINICENLFQQHIYNLICAFQWLPVRSRFSVNSDSYLHFIVTQLKSRLPCCWNRARLDCHSHGSHIVDHFLCNCLYRFKFCTFLRLCTCYFMYKNRSCYTAAPNCIQTVLNRNIIIRNNIFDRNTVHLRHLCCHLKIHDIAGIVLYNHKDTFVRRYRFDTFINLIRRRRSKDRSCNGSIQHTFSYKSTMCRLMSASATTDQSNFSFFFSGSYYYISAI